MQELVTDLVAEVLSFLAMVLGSIVFAGIGLLGEQAGLANVLAGDLAVGAWELFIGSWAIVVGVYLLGVKQVLPRMRRLVAE